MDTSINHIKNLLKETFSNAQIEVVDTKGNGNHIKASITTDDFIGKSELERHQLVYQALGSIVGDKIHALALETKTISEDTATPTAKAQPLHIPLDNDTLKKIHQAVNTHDVVLFMKGTKDTPMCGFSALVVDILKNLKVEFSDIDVMSAPEIRKNIKLYSNWATLPQLYVKGQFIGGCDVIKEMYISQELHKIFAKLYSV